MERFDGTRTTPKFRGMLRLRIWKKMRNNVSVRTFKKKKKMGPHQYGLCNDDEALFRCEIPTLNQRSNDRMIELKLGNNTIFMSKQNRPVDYASGPFGRSHLRFRACCKKGKTI